MALLGIDVGSSGCKAIVFSDTAQVLSEYYAEYPSVENPYEISGELIWDKVRTAIFHCTESVSERIDAIGVSSFGESFVPIDKDGRVLMVTMLYTDKRGKIQCDELVGKLGNEKIMNITGVKPQPMYSLPKIMYIKENHPDVYLKTYKFLLIGSFIIYKLTGECVIDYSLASRTMGFDVINKEWSDLILKASSIDRSKLPKVMPSGVVAGTVTKECCVQLNLSESTKVVTGGHDQICAALGAGVLDSCVAIDGTGTVECITPIFNDPILDKSFLDNNYACVPYVIENTYATYAFNFTGGAILKWYKNNFAKYESMLAEEKGIGAYMLLDENAAKEPTKLIVIPHFAGSATPDMNENAVGAFIGLKFDTDASILYRAMIEGVTYEMLYNLEILEENGICIKELRAVGGGSKSQLWLQIKADILGKTIVPLETSEAGIVGAVILAGVATGVYKDLKQACEVFVKTKYKIYPNNENTDIYAKNYERYKRARNLLSDIYEGEYENG